VTILFAPALVIRLETSFAEIEVLGTPFYPVLRIQNMESLL